MLKKTVVIILTLMISFMLFTLPIMAETEIATFNLWTLYRNAMRFNLYVGSNDYTIHANEFTNDNTVSISDSNVTNVSNNIHLTNNEYDWDYLNNFSLSIPTTRIEPTFYIDNRFLNIPITFNVTLEIKLYNNGVSFGRDFDGQIAPVFDLYTGVSNTYNSNYCEISNIKLLKYTSTVCTISFDCTKTFTSAGYICGFWCRVGTDGLGIPVSFTDTYNVNVACTYTLSPLIFSNDITADDIGQAVGDAFAQQQENEKQEANTSGNDAVDSVTGAIPSDTGGFLEAIKLLSSSMNYEGTDAVWIVPSMKIPAMEGVTEEIKLTDDLQINFANYVNMIPAKALSVARVVCTLALIIFCVKELYGLIQEVMISRRSGANE